MFYTEKILSAFAGDIAVIDGVNGTMMIAGEAACTVAVAIP